MLLSCFLFLLIGKYFVIQVFLSRSWASVRVMTADQRAKLLKRVFSGCSNRKLSYKDCAKIAKDLNLTMEQVFILLFTIFLVSTSVDQ